MPNWIKRDQNVTVWYMYFTIMKKLYQSSNFSQVLCGQQPSHQYKNFREVRQRNNNHSIKTKERRLKLKLQSQVYARVGW